MGFSIPIKFPSDCGGGGGGKVDRLLLVLPPRCEIFLVRTLGLPNKISCWAALEPF